MKKSKITGLLICSTLLLSTTALALAGCGGNSHQLTAVGEQAATCTEDGHKAYYSCSHCDLIFEDADAKKETTLEAVKISALGHKVTLVPAKAADCATAGNIQYYDCERCDVNFSDEAVTQVAENVIIKALGHDMKPVAQVDPIKDQVGKKAHYICSHEEGVLYADEYGDKTVTEEELKINALKETIDGTATSDFYNAEKAYVVGASNVKEGGLGFVMNGSLQEDGVYIHIMLNHNLSATEQVGDHGKIGIIWMIHNEDNLTHPDLGTCLSQYGLSELVLDGTLKQHQPYSNNLLKFNTKTNEADAPAKYTTTWEFFVSNADLAAMNQGKFAEAFEVKEGKTVLKRGYNVLVNAIANMTAGESQNDKFDDNNGSICGSMDSGAWYMWRKDGYGDWENEKAMVLTENGFESAFLRYENTITVKDESQNATVTVPNTVEFGKNLSIEITPAENYIIHKVKLNGKEYSVEKDESTGKYTASVAVDGSILGWNETEITVQAVAVKQVAIAGTLSAKDLAGVAVESSNLNGTLILRGTVNTFELTVTNGAYSETVYEDEYEVFFYGYETAAFAVEGADSKIPELRATIAYGSTDKVTVNNTDKTITIAGKDKANDNKWAGSAELVTPAEIGTEIVFETTIKMDPSVSTWGDAWAWQRYGIQLTESGNGFYFWSWNRGENNTFIRAFSGENIENCSKEGAVVNGNEAANGWIYASIISDNGVKVRVVRMGDTLVLNMLNGANWVKLGSVACGANDKTKIAVYGVTAKFEFSKLEANGLTHVPAVDPSEANGFVGNIEYYCTGDGESKVCYLPDGTVTTLEEVTIKQVNVTLTVTAKEHDGTTEATLENGTEIELKGKYKNYTYTVGGANNPDKMLSDTYEAYLYGYGKINVVVPEAGGAVEVALVKTYAYAHRTAEVTDNGTKVTITGNGCPADGTPWSGYAEFVTDQTNADTAFEFVVKDTNVRNNGLDWAARRIAIQVAGNSGFFFWFNNANEVMIRHLKPENLGVNGAGQGGNYEGAEICHNHGWMKGIVEDQDGSGLKFRILRNGTKIVLNAYNGTEWVKIGETTCNAEDKTSLTFYAQGDDYEFSGISLNALSKKDAVKPNAENGYQGNIEYYYAGEGENRVFYLPDGTVTTLEEVMITEVNVMFTVTAKEHDGTTATLEDGTEIELKGKYNTYTYTVGGANNPDKMLADTYEAYLYGYGKISVVVPEAGGTIEIALQKTYAYTSGSAVVTEAGNKVTVTGAGSADWDADRWAGTAEWVLGTVKAEKNVSYELTLKSLKEGPFPSQRLVIRVAGEHSGFFFWLNGNEGNVRAMVAENVTKMSKEGNFIYSEPSTAYEWIKNAALGDGLQIRIIRLGDKIVFNAKNGEVWVCVGEIECDANAETNLTFFAGGSDWEFSNVNVAKAEYVASGNGKLGHYKSGENYYSENGSVVSEEAIALWESATLTLTGIAKDTEVVLFNANHSVTAKVGENGVVTLTGESAVLKKAYTVIVGTFGFEADFTTSDAVEKTFETLTVGNATVKDKEGDNAYVIDMGAAKDSTEYSVTFNLKTTTQGAGSWQYRYALLFINGDANTVTGIGNIPGHDESLMLWQATAANPNDKYPIHKKDEASMKFCELVKGESGANIKFIRSGSKATMCFEYNGTWVELYSVTLGSGETNLKFACNNGIEWVLSGITIDYVPAAEATV